MNKLWTDLEQYYTLTAQTPQPVETDKRERLETPDSLARRDFLKLGGVAAVFSLVGCMQRPAEKIIPYLNQPEETVPGVATWYASTCGECQAACGVLARVREGRPVKLEGNPNHPLNQGKLCARGQASLYNLYDPGRMRAPVRRKADGGWEEADFDTLDTEIAGKLKAANGEVVLVTGAWHGPARVDLVRKFLAGIPGSSHLRFEVLADQLWLDTLNAAFGTQLPALYAFDRAELVVTFGADPLAGSTYRMKYLREFADRRDPESRPMLKLVSFDPAMSETAALADERHPVRGSQLYKVAGALARQIISVRRASRYALGDRVDAALAEFDSHKVETELGLAPDTIAKLVDQLIAAGSRSLLISENVSNSGPGGRQLHLLVNLLNYALGAVGSTFLLDSVPAAHRTDSPAALARLVKRMADGKVGVVIFCGMNPAHVLPEEAGFAAALARVSLKVSLSDRLDETAALCDYVLPSLHGAECWNDAEPQPGVYSLQQPTISPIWNNRQAEDSLIRIAFLAGNRAFAAGEAPAVWRDYLKNYWKENVYPATGASGSFDSFWVGRLR
ncbi:MAG TPA: molybdopterin-dependent oxidoreductase, partial [Candidatus Glassbacteria bacterium]|nr:molybdopterin-dependent oxidoreductase [Candidatus Glassbacteria bacterium]